MYKNRSQVIVMSYKLSELVLKIELVYDKPPLPGWQDHRRTIHLHSLYWVHEGTGVFTLDGHEFPVRAGSLLYLKPGRKLWMASATDNPLHMTMILFHAAAAVHSRGQWQAKALDSLDMGEVQVFEAVEQEECESRIKALRTAWVPGDEWREAASQYQLLKLLKQVGRRKQTRLALERGNDDAFRQGKAYIDSHYFTDVRLTEVAALCRTNLKSLRKRFLQELALSPKEYLDRVRNEHAMRLLEHTDEPLKRIAAACGYYDEFHFSKSFKKRNGLSPSAFRSSGAARCQISHQ